INPSGTLPPFHRYLRHQRPPPKVQVYTREPAEPGTGNSLICYLNNFQPPEVEVDLLENGVVIPGAVQSDLMFESQWQYHLTKRVPFIPREGARYACRVNHMGRTTNHAWGEKPNARGGSCRCESHYNI
uniref:Beta-2-microglobulin n=1 Tax=Gadus morhua TaxID=8049 RepID=A0A8C5CT49_GADMO